VALINHRTHEIHFKIVYYGPGLCGKTTNLRSLHDRLPPERRGKMISIATDHERTLFFDFLPIDLGHVNGFLTRFHLYTVPGQVYYRLSRRAVLQGVDGLVFVADSHPAREAANRESLADLNEHLRTLGVTGPALARIPWVFQWNKRDSAVATPIDRLHKALNPQGWPEFEAVASDGKGVSETLRAACKAVLARLGSGHAPTAASPTAPVLPPHASMPQRTTGAPGAVATATPPAIATATVPPPAIATLPAPTSAASIGVATTVAPPLAPPMLSPVSKTALAAAEPDRSGPPAIAPSLPGPPPRT
jgi:signal recognition particle receptor subunit beta